MKADATRAWFGGAKRVAGASTKFAAHPHEARFWQIQCGASLTISIDLPRLPGRNLALGLQMVFENFGAPTDGAFEFLDANEEPLVFQDGSKQLDPTLWAKVYIIGYDVLDRPIWSVVRLPAGPRSVLA